jgi:hypothetical protein
MHTSKPKLTKAPKPKASWKVLPPIPSSLCANERTEESTSARQKIQSFYHSISWFLHVLKPLLYCQERLFSCIAFMQQRYSEAKDLVDS